MWKFWLMVLSPLPAVVQDCLRCEEGLSGGEFPAEGFPGGSRSGRGYCQTDRILSGQGSSRCRSDEIRRLPPFSSDVSVTSARRRADAGDCCSRAHFPSSGRRDGPGSGIFRLLSRECHRGKENHILSRAAPGRGSAHSEASGCALRYFQTSDAGGSHSHRR